MKPDYELLVAVCIRVRRSSGNAWITLAHSFTMTKRSIDIDAKLLSKAMRLRGGRTKSEVVHPAMKLLVRDLKEDKARPGRGPEILSSS
jgi:Arc/MetJ family transcription regulator